MGIFKRALDISLEAAQDMSKLSYIHRIRAWIRASVLTLRHLIHLRRSRRLAGLEASSDHLPLRGLVTMRYPKEQLKIPDHGRNQLHNEMDDCILCDKCARICPVDCIEISSIRSPELLGHTSNGSPKRLLAEYFAIDMAKCCFCGLCTIVCPTECLTMQPVYAYSSSSVSSHKLVFAEMSQEEAHLHQRNWDSFLETKQKK